MAYNDIGDEIYKQRISLKLSIRKLAEITGVSFTTISRLESKQYKYINQANFDKLNTVLDLNSYTKYIARDTSKELATLLRKKRTELGLNQTELSKLLGYKDPSTICKLEAGRYSKLHIITFLRLQKVLDLDEEEFQLFVKEARTKEKKKVVVNSDALNRIVSEKSKQLRLSHIQLATKAHVATRFLTQMEEQKEELNILSTLRLIKFLSLSKEEIEKCIPGLEDEYIDYLLEDEKVYRKDDKHVRK